MQKNYDELIFKYERDYPDYYNFKYRSLTITNNDIVKKLRAGQVLIEYLIDEPGAEGENGHVYCLAYSSRGSSFHSVEITGCFTRQIETVIGQLTNKNVGETNLADFCSYVSAAKYLHSVLIEPLSIAHSVNDLIIIPDGKLAYLPFDALLTEAVDTTRINYRELPYLVFDYNISYSYSATLHFEYFRSSHKQRSNILAFAPEYAYEDIDLNKEAYSRQLPSRAVLNPLPGAVDEVRRLKDIHGCTSFIGKEASETKFKAMAANYDILHMAMHTIMNDSIPMFSKLVFSRSTDTINDGFLNTQEIYNMKLNARLAVLSACNTGTGKLRAGEGVMSMARAFLYSGCPSIIMTMWEVEDRVSADIMIAFYRYLFKGYSKPEALRKAKINHIQNADPFKAHPYFWQAYIVVGDPSPLKFNNIALVSILVFSIILIVFFVFWKKNTAKNNGKIIRR
jgi:CHAT domain-containing protein